eukprot:6198488-Pleurochrysis_carterae.AAC.2
MLVPAMTARCHAQRCFSSRKPTRLPMVFVAPFPPTAHHHPPPLPTTLHLPLHPPLPPHPPQRPSFQKELHHADACAHASSSGGATMAAPAKASALSSAL